MICGSKEFSVEDQKVYERLKRQVKFRDGHYQLPLPWRSDEVMPNNKSMALGRLKHLKKKLIKDPLYKEQYASQMQIMIDKGFAEMVHEDEQMKSSHGHWYIPHHGVRNPHKPDKLLIVFDCATSYKGVSLNNSLMPGPDLVNALVAVLLRFRKDPIALVADIESMVYQVHVAPQDRNSLRFLWWPGGDFDGEPTAHRMKVHLFGATSSPSCAAFLLRQAAVDFGRDYEPHLSYAVENCFYVDDCLLSAPDDATAIQIMEGLRCLLAEAGFWLTKWLSNSKSVVETVPEDERSKSNKIAFTGR